MACIKGWLFSLANANFRKLWKDQQDMSWFDLKNNFRQFSKIKLKRKRKLQLIFSFCCCCCLKHAQYPTCFLFLLHIFALSSAKVKLIFFEDQWSWKQFNSYLKTNLFSIFYGKKTVRKWLFLRTKVGKNFSADINFM